jgi:UDP-N-acetylmuramoylalanine--D-glutamate ligase
MVGHLLRSLELDAVDAGNIGTPLSEFALEGRNPWIALEMSSFQLHDTPSVKPLVGVVTNLAPDHLDRYKSAEEYYADKALIFRNDHPGARWVWNADDTEVMRLPARRPANGDKNNQLLVGESWTFSIENEFASGYYDRKANQLVVLDRPLLERKELALFGDHNVANALAASLAVMVADPAHRTAEAREKLAEGLRTFRALEHRLEPVGEIDGVLWINDSKATNVSSTLVAVQGMTRPTILLLGGRHKGEPYTALAKDIKRVGGTVLAYGESAELVEKDLTGLVPVERLGSDFGKVIARARQLAKKGSVVLLSPACSSYDMFDNYIHRGSEFRRLARGGKKS